MNSGTNRKRNRQPPNLLKGILTSVIGTTLCILVCSWLIIDYHIERLVIKRTSEYAHSIARIAADSSAEALLSNDKLQLDLLVLHVANDPYIRQATIFSEDGRIASQYPQENAEEPIRSQDPSLVTSEISDTSLDEQNKKQAKSSFITRLRNKTVIEPIIYQAITAGWFKLEIDQGLLEKNFREVFLKVQLLTGTIALIFISLLMIS